MEGLTDILKTITTEMQKSLSPRTLKDTVIPYNPVEKSGRGFTFKSYNAYDMLDAIRRAVGTYYSNEDWNACITNAMSADYSWKSSAKEYVELYKKL